MQTVKQETKDRDKKKYYYDLDRRHNKEVENMNYHSGIQIVAAGLQIAMQKSVQSRLQVTEQML